MSQASISLDKRDAHVIIALLGEYQSYLESEIEATLVPGEPEPFDDLDKPNVKRARRCWRRAENLISELEVSLA